MKDFISPVIISDFIALSVITVMIVGFNHFAYSRMIVFGTIGMSIFLEIILFSLFYYHRKLDRESETMDNVEVFLKHMETLANSREFEVLPKLKHLKTTRLFLWDITKSKSYRSRTRKYINFFVNISTTTEIRRWSPPLPQGLMFPPFRLMYSM
ncbi:MAG: hypothetical protein IPH84_06770 [Bacteroidales bacterium]|nr:hypothetical protein [Bacteroidales bacterium]